MRRAGKERRKMLLLVCVALLASAVATLAYATHLFRRSELQSIDTRLSIRGKQKPPSTSSSSRSSLRAEKN